VTIAHHASGRHRHHGRPARRALQGQATVEVVLALPLVVIALLLVLQVALVGRGQLLVTDAAREGARAAAVGATAGEVAAVVARAPGLDPRRIEVKLDGTGRPGDDVRVTVRYRSPTDVALVGPLVGEPVLRASVAMRREDPTEN
jgi:hypothetical protein